jgi:Suppressor of forked protein (Suf)
MTESFSYNEINESLPILLGGEDVMEEDEAIAFETSVPIEPLTTSDELISKILASPYPHHITGPTSSRFRNALSRINTNPYDVEAWQALMTEAHACWRGIQLAVHNLDSDTHARLDWIESCYGNLLKVFPYATAYWETVIEILLAQSARVGEENGPFIDYGQTFRARQSELKLERIFRDLLGIEMNGTQLLGSHLGGMCTSSVEIWLLYVKKRIRDANRQPIQGPDEKARVVRENTIQAYEVAIEYTSFVQNNHLIWKQYLTYVKSWVPNQAQAENALSQSQMVQLRSIYKRLVTHPMLGLDQLWQEYEAFERSQNEALALALLGECAPKYQHARSVYLDRNRVYNFVDLQMNRLSTPPVDLEDEDYAGKLVEEHRLLSLWKKRCAYERTNPERLGQDELIHRIRQAYKDFVCTFTLYPEAWHTWSTWELLQTGTHKESTKVECSIAVLQLAQVHIQDCTLLVYAESQVLELYSDQPDSCIAVMERFLEKYPNTLGYVLFQQMIRRYKGKDEARSVFAKARRVLKYIGDNNEGVSGEKTEEIKDSETDDQGVASSSILTGTNHHRMVTNRLDPAICSSSNDIEPPQKSQEDGDIETSGETETKVIPGPITWQLYAAHATMEHRLNHSATTAARVYELGLRKHGSFLTNAQYVLRYAQLLLELQDTENLRALLTRAVAACEADGNKGDAAAALWDMTLRFESIMSGSDPRNIALLKTVERRRHAALYGPEMEDVATGSLSSGNDVIQVSGQKISISEQLIRTEGYDVSSSIVSGFSRAVNVLEVMGLWGSDVSILGRRKKRLFNANDDELRAGSKSDASFQRRLNFQKQLEAGESIDSFIGTDSISKLSSARERLVGTGITTTGPSSAAALAIQQSPEWLRPLLNCLPASRLRTAILGKPPLHLVEMALSTLRSSTLPADRPTDILEGSIPRKRTLEEGDDSEDENDTVGGIGGGYGNQFRARQKARIDATSGISNGTY